MFHAKDGWYFDRLPGGMVRIERRTNDAKNTLIEALTVTPETWASIVASVSELGETGDTHRHALIFHGAPSVQGQQNG
jgi:hypothetical protein